MLQEEFQQYQKSYEEFKLEANPEGESPTYHPCRENEVLAAIMASSTLVFVIHAVSKTA